VLPPFLRFPPKVPPKPPAWRARPIFIADWMHHPATVYGWNLIDPRGLVRASFLAPLNSVADEARRQMKGMRT
jgi:hypothetical protein